MPSKPMHRRRNNHHLVWPDREQVGIFRRVRDLPCCQVQIDIEVHKVLHKIYGPPKTMTYEDAEWLIDRHFTRACACFTPNVHQTNILTINDPLDPREGD